MKPYYHRPSFVIPPPHTLPPTTRTMSECTRFPRTPAPSVMMAKPVRSSNSVILPSSVPCNIEDADLAATGPVEQSQLLTYASFVAKVPGTYLITATACVRKTDADDKNVLADFLQLFIGDVDSPDAFDSVQINAQWHQATRSPQARAVSLSCGRASRLMPTSTSAPTTTPRSSTVATCPR